ncbi:MAG: RIP metalloprotease RseP [Minisyncoccia bacterium]
MILTIILFLLVLAVLIFVHELGHFIVAKLCGVRVDEFCVGFPPRIASWGKGETKYSIGMIPFGGFVKIFGEDGNEAEKKEVGKSPDALLRQELPRNHKEGISFSVISKWKQASILLSGIFFNLIFAWILISLSFTMGMITSVDMAQKNIATNVSTIVLSVTKDSPAEKAGIMLGDRIINISNEKESFNIPSMTEVQKVVKESVSSVKVTYSRNDVQKEVSVIPEISNGVKMVGVAMDTVGTIKYGFFRSFYEGGKETIIIAGKVLVGLYDLIKNSIFGKADFSQVTGPVGIAGMVNQARFFGISYFLGFIALISINLGMINLVPFPALDGGRVLFVAIEAVFRREIKPIIANILNIIGFALLILLMAVLTFKDIAKLIK